MKKLLFFTDFSHIDGSVPPCCHQLRFHSGRCYPSASINPVANYNGDGVINATDVTMLITYVMGH